MKTSSPRRKRLEHKTLIHIVTGSIATYKIGDLIEGLREEGARVICVMTESAKHFVTPLVLHSLSGEKVYHDFFSENVPYGVVHTALAEEADAILVAPSTADFIAKLAAGMADDLASCLILAARRPILIAPAMNDQMYEHPLTRRNIKTLKEIGYHFVDPIQGHLVCGKQAVGHIAEAPALIDRVVSLLSKKS